MGICARSYIYCVIAAGAAVLSAGLMNWPAPGTLGWLVLLGVSILASVLKVRLPGMRGTYSLSFLPLLFGIAHFSLGETVAAGCAGALAQTVWNRKTRPTVLQALFNIANVAVSAGLCILLTRTVLSAGLIHYRVAVLAFIAGVYFVVNTMLVSGVLSLLEGKSFAGACEQWYLWSFPYYLVGAALVGLIPAPVGVANPEAWLILLPLLYLVHFFVGLGELQWSARESGRPPLESLDRPTRFYLVAVLAAGFVLLLGAVFRWQSEDPLRFVCYLALALTASTLKVRVPGMTGTISVNFVLLLVALAELRLPEVVVMSALAGGVQCIWRPKRRPTSWQVLFNLSCLSLSCTIAYLVCRQGLAQFWDSPVVMLLVTTLVLYACNTILVSAALSLRERGSLTGIWQRCYFWTGPYYIVGAMAAGLMIATNRMAGWPPSLLVLPAMALVYVSYRAHVAQAVSSHEC